MEQSGPLTTKHFSSLQEMETSSWLANIKDQFNNDIWPKECVRCKRDEETGQESVRLRAISFDKHQSRKDYLIVDVLLDNICNGACQFCSKLASTKIGGLISKDYVIRNNANQFWELPTDKIIQLDISGGEPSASANCKNLLENLPPNVRSVRINTNCSLLLEGLESLTQKGISVTITASFDGLYVVHDYVRWPITWNKFYTNLSTYKNMPGINVNLWTTLNTLNINDLDNIFNFVNEHKIHHSYSCLVHPAALDIRYTNRLTTRAKIKFQNSNDDRLIQLSKNIAIDKDNEDELRKFIDIQDKLRNIKIEDYITF